MASRERKRKQRAKRLERAAADSGQPARVSPESAETGAPSANAPAARARSRPKHRPQAEDAPLPPWGKFPLVELAILAGIIVLIVGFFFVSDDGTKVVTIVAGLFLCSLGGLEIAVREHVAGYKSHTLVLSALPTVAVLGGLFYAAPSSFPPVARLALGAVIFGGSAFGLTKLFSARSGGRAFRVKAPRKR